MSFADTMLLRKVGLVLLVSCLIVSSYGDGEDDEFPRCNCEDEGMWSVESIMQCQKVSDLLIAIAYFSIPIELLYFISCSNVPFKWVLVQFIAFIVLCGLTHLLNVWTYDEHPFQLMVALTIFKFLTALVSCATAITLLTLFPLLLQVKVRELFLKKKAWDLDREVEMMKQQKEATMHVRMLTQEIRKSLDRHTILYSTLIELSKTLSLQNCAVWMPNEDRTRMKLTHELKAGSSMNSSGLSIPYGDPDVQEIKLEKGVKILRPDSALGMASVGEGGEPGAVAAIRMPMLRVSNFKGGTPEMIPQCYAILVLVLPSSDSRVWSYQELEIIEVVADQVAVALSHAAVLEESQNMRDQMLEQNRALQQARKDAMMASQARNSFQKVMSHGMRRPMHSILGLLSMVQQENLGSEQKTIVDSMVKTTTVLSTLINDIMEISSKDSGRFPLQMRTFGLHSMIKEAACLARCLCVYNSFSFEIEVESTLSNLVIGDERRIFQVILHMIGNLLNTSVSGGTVYMRVVSESATENRNDQKWGIWIPSSSEGHAYVKFEFGFRDANSQSEGIISSAPVPNVKYNSEGIVGGLSFTVCKKLVRTMQGNIWVIPNSLGHPQSMAVVLRFQLQQSIGGIFDQGESSEPPPSNSLFRGLQVLLADNDVVNRAVTRKLLQRLGCRVISVSSGLQCLSALGPAGTPFHIVLLDINLSDMDAFEVTMRIRKFRSKSWPLVVALTASGDEEVLERCRQVGMNGVICKPVLLNGIAEELRRVLHQAKNHVSR